MSASVHELNTFSLKRAINNAPNIVKNAVGRNTDETTDFALTGTPSDLTQKLIRAWSAIGPNNNINKVTGFEKAYTMIPTTQNSNQVVQINFLDSSTVNALVLIITLF